MTVSTITNFENIGEIASLRFAMTKRHDVIAMTERFGVIVMAERLGVIARNEVTWRSHYFQCKAIRHEENRE